MRGHPPSDPPEAEDPSTGPDAGVRDERARLEQDVFRPPPPRFRRRRAVGRARTWDILAMIAVGGGLGSVARYLVALALPVQPGTFPWATFLVNVSGCFVLGAVMVFVLDVWPPRRYVRPFLGIGFIGGYTTFSAFTMEIVDLASSGTWTTAEVYAVGSVIAGLAAVWCGVVLARALAGLTVRQGDETTP